MIFVYFSQADSIYVSFLALIRDMMKSDISNIFVQRMLHIYMDIS